MKKLKYQFVKNQESRLCASHLTAKHDRSKCQVNIDPVNFQLLQIVCCCHHKHDIIKKNITNKDGSGGKICKKKFDIVHANRITNIT